LKCITVPVEESFKERLNQFPWVNWSQVGQETLIKRYLFEKYIRTNSLSKAELLLCEKLDWHPVDELPFKKKFVEEVKRAKHYTKIKSDKEFGKFFDDL
jgi:hypothetical protein